MTIFVLNPTIKQRCIGRIGNASTGRSWPIDLSFFCLNMAPITFSCIVTSEIYRKIFYLWVPLLNVNHRQNKLPN